MNVYELAPRFAKLFSGLDTAFGTGAGRWIKRPPRTEDFVIHLSGEGAGIGIAPLKQDSTVSFAAIDLDEPDFDAARAMQGFLPGTSFIERSRSGNAHVWVFFKEPIEAWVPMGILKEACIAAGKPRVEVFPKNHDFTKVKLGNYVNLPYHGSDRPIVHVEPNPTGFHPEIEWDLKTFLADAERTLQDPEEWRKQAKWLLIDPPEQRKRQSVFGAQTQLHMCGEHIIEHAADNPITEGHRAAVYFALAKMLTNWQEVDSDEALALMESVNDVSPDPISEGELERILRNAERGQFTSTGCDDPLVQPFAHPDCPIAKGNYAR
jgi:hypothetical protein